MMLEEAQQNYDQAKAAWEQLTEEFDSQKNNFLVRCMGGAYFDNVESIEFISGEINTDKALAELKRPRQIMREELVDGILQARRRDITDRLEHMTSVDRRCKQIMDRFQENPFLNSPALVSELGRLQVEQAGYRLNSGQINSDLARLEESFKEQIIAFDQESRKFLESWKSDLDYLKSQYEVCCELKLHVDSALRDRDQAEEQLMNATFFDTHQQ